MTRFKVLSFALLLLLAAGSVVAQEQTGAIQGTVTDTSGGVLPGVTVEAVNAKGQRFSAVSDSGGNFRFPSVPPGVYTVTATLSGMEPASVRDLEVRLGQAPRVDLKMRLPRVAETISVTAEAPLVDVTSSATATSIRSETFEKLPKGRDFTSVVTQAASANAESKAGGISIDGASGSENRYIVDGADTTHPRTGVSGKPVITDFIDEVQVKSAGYQAEFGGAIGGVINVVTKTGTNDFRGTVGAYYTDRAWGGSVRPTLQLNAAGSAPEYVTFRRDDVKLIEPGFTLGGPILRDRLWFFGAYNPQIQKVERTVTFTNGVTDTFDQDFQRDNAAATLSGSLGAKFLFKLAGNNSGERTENLLPPLSGRGSSAQTQYVGRKDTFEDWSASGYADFIASPQWFFSARGGRWYNNFYQEGYPADPRIRFIAGSPSIFPEVPVSLHRPAGFQTLSSNSGTAQDSFTRDNLYIDGSWFPQFAGTHRIKGGVQIENLSNEVDQGFLNYNILVWWGRPGRFQRQEEMGKYGGAEVYVFKTFGKVESDNLGLFLQDSWTTLNDRLTLNIGVRTERERIPSYADKAAGLPDVAIEFGFEDKLAPRLGFSYDLFGNGRWKAFGSWGRYYDITKLEMPRGSFGGDKWINWQFKVDDPDWTKWTCTNVTTSPKDLPTCTGLTRLRYIDLRAPSLDLIEPDLKPMQSEEFNIGLQHELTNTIAIGARYVNKRLIRTIEDVGILVKDAQGNEHEEYFIANPGEGIAKQILGPSFPDFPKPVRDYDALELEGTKRFQNRWSLHASYVYSRLYGNYSGLANSDENGRTSPNVNRFADSLFNMFDAQGNPVLGRLSTDRPHQFKAQVVYALPWGTSLGLNQRIASGIPINTEFMFHGVPFFAYGRGDLGRTPTLKQTDIYLQHDFRLFRNYTFQLGVNVLNLFDSDTATNVNNRFSDVSVNVTDPEFFRGFDPTTKIGNLERNRNPLYGQESEFQPPRSVRVSAKFTF